MSDTLVENVGAVVTGDLETPLRHVDNIYIRNGVIEEFDSETTTADTVVDAKGTTVAPGLIDGHVHPVSGGFTPRQNTLGWTESYLQSGVTSMVSAGEIHQPGRPKDAAGTKALAVLNKKSFENERPGGVKMHAGTLVLTDDLDVSDIDDVHAEGVDHTKIIFPLSDLDPDSEVLSDFYFPDVGDAVNRVFGVDLNTPPGQTTARFLSHPKGDPTISLTDDLHARVLVAVPPWTPDDVRAYDRRGRRLSLVVVAAETEEASVLD